MNTSKQEAQKRLDAIQKEMDELRKIIEAPDKLKEIDWSKLHSDTLIEVVGGAKRYFFCVTNAYSICAYRDGKCSATTGTETLCSHSVAKLIENPKFTVWEGGECPVPEGVLVEIILRSGSKSIEIATPMWWGHDRAIYDIIAYRIIGVAEGYTPFFRGVEF